MNIQITLTNGRKVMVRSIIRKAGEIVGFLGWDGRFISKINIR